jgi:hypothetical protein
MRGGGFNPLTNRVSGTEYQSNVSAIQPQTQVLVNMDAMGQIMSTIMENCSTSQNLNQSLATSQLGNSLILNY